MAYKISVLIPKGEWIASNGPAGRLHWAEKARRVKALRERAGWTARRARIPALQRARIDAYLHGRTRRRVDPANAYPTIKALVDGLVDAHVLPDDDSLHLDGPHMYQGSADPAMTEGWHRITLIITPLVVLADEDDVDGQVAA
ncbi:hypothetical protein [Actinomyces procaprae]|uniref:hypothetical protein n=1 Tax=Actinomyces procaprae TaxID=2560010 RepID=UPI0010A26959|nr:hypothetical protein [Actinomyces procaprae]